jgi:hypothetical protein
MWKEITTASIEMSVGTGGVKKEKLSRSFTIIVPWWPKVL